MNKYFTWSVVGFFVLISPLILELRFKDDIEAYHEHKESFNSVLLEVGNFKEKYYSGRIPKSEYKDLTQDFISSLSEKNIKVVSALVEKGRFNVILEIPPSSLSCVFRDEISSTTSLVQSLTPTAKCKSDTILYQFTSI